MSDISFKFMDDQGIFDMSLLKGDVEKDEGLRTAVILSLFTDQRVTLRELPTGETKRRGWWGDAIPDVQSDRWGSKLWLLDREKQTDEILERAREYSEEALAWMIEDGVAKSVSVSTSYPSRGILRIEVKIERPSRDSESLSFDYAWQGESSREEVG